MGTVAGGIPQMPMGVEQNRTGTPAVETGLGALVCGDC